MSSPHYSIIPQLLRFQLYADPSRQSYTQLHPNMEVTEPPKFGYGRPIRVGDDADDPATWPRYRVAHLLFLRQEADPDRPGKNRIVYEVYVAREVEWPEFGWPE